MTAQVYLWIVLLCLGYPDHRLSSTAIGEARELAQAQPLVSGLVLGIVALELVGYDAVWTRG